MELQSAEKTKATSPEEAARALSSPLKGGMILRAMILRAREERRLWTASHLAPAPAPRLQGASSAEDPGYCPGSPDL